MLDVTLFSLSNTSQTVPVYISKPLAKYGVNLHSFNSRFSIYDDNSSTSCRPFINISFVELVNSFFKL